MSIPLSDNMRGAVFMSISMAAFVVNDTAMKLVAEHLSVFQAMFLRGIMTSLMLAAFCHYKGVLIFRVPKGDRLLVILRLIGEVGGAAFYLTALFHMPLANATAILQSLPLAVTLAGAIFLREPVGWRRYLAISAGFIGVLMIVRPGTEGFNEYSIYAVISVSFIVMRDLATRRLSVAIPTLFVTFLTSCSVMTVGAVLSAFAEWKPITVDGISLLVLAALFVMVGYQCSITAMRAGDLSFTSPFRYTILIWAIILGIIVFGEFPNIWMILGSIIIVGSGVYTFYRERYLIRKMRKEQMLKAGEALKT
ncbi:MAG: EamA family transporter [Sneathiella sp.]|jgi:drug/metabolite transporter (DMT)-like permease|uniref:DMT family transporter n=1 Tax=Sneathiella sp. TaxID=1964365 RepID=UPI000C50A874|nr:DMT family transporter [Sneathiella sp.]MAL77603.1 EamA family transporter [Sneathiella sp.]